MLYMSPNGETVFVIHGLTPAHATGLTKVSNNIAMDAGKMQPPTQGASTRKRQNLTLDLNSATAKRNKVQSLLTSPDVQMLKLTSPELEKFLSQNPSLATPTPSGYITEDQINYVKGFEEALENLRSAEKANKDDLSDASVAAANTLVTLGNSAVNHQARVSQNDTMPSTASKSSSIVETAPSESATARDSASVNSRLPLSVPASITTALHVSVEPQPRPSSVASAASFDSTEGVKIKDEPDDQGSLSGGEYSSGSLMSPPNRPKSTGMSPIDMDDQERIKLERKRQRNRLAASKCRKRKLEKISLLDDRVKQLKAENADLAAVVKKMKASVAMLKQEVMEHVNSGCDIRIADATSLA